MKDGPPRSGADTSIGVLLGSEQLGAPVGGHTGANGSANIRNRTEHYARLPTEPPSWSAALRRSRLVARHVALVTAAKVTASP